MKLGKKIDYPPYIVSVCCTDFAVYARPIRECDLANL